MYPPQNFPRCERRSATVRAWVSVLSESAAWTTSLSQGQATQDVHRRDDADQHADAIDDEEAMHVEVAHQSDDLPGRGVPPHAEDGWRHHVAHRSDVHSLDLEAPPQGARHRVAVFDLR